jgi:hypothetical protein
LSVLLLFVHNTRSKLLLEKNITMLCNQRKNVVFLLFLALVFGGGNWLHAQGVTQKNWYLGSGTQGIQFGRPDYVPSLIPQPSGSGIGGGAVATDPNTGNLLFYTDGDNVYDVSRTLMPNSGLGGNTTLNQSAIITPVPDAPNQYYIFTMTAGGTIEQAIVQTDAPGSETFPTPPLGNVISKNVATGLTGQSEGMIIIPHPNGQDSWLITQTANSDSYTVTAITSGGLTSTTVPGLGVPLTAASFSFNEESGRLAVAPKDANKNVAVLNFDPLTGDLTFDPVFNQFLLNTGAASNTTEAVYDIEWSKDGGFLYISRNGDASVPIAPDVLQVDLATASLPVSILPPTLDIVRSYGLQMGPDSAIYHLYENSAGEFLMGRINDTDSVASLVIYTPEVFPSTNFEARQFPSFSPPAETAYTLTFTPLGSCTNSPITFLPTVTPIADSVVWDFGDGSPTVNSWSPIHTFQDPPGSDVIATAFVNGVAVATSSTSLSLTQFDLQLTLQSDTTACSCELIHPRVVVPPCDPFTVEPQSQGGASPTYQWYGPSGELVGKTSLILDAVDSAGYYYVKATDGTCSVTAGQYIKEYDQQDQRANIWHFGSGAGIDFNPLFYPAPDTGPADPIPSPVNAPEGVSVISDRNGQVILSTDGHQVYDRDGNPLVSSATTPVDASTQATIIVPVPGDESLFYIFTTEAVENGSHRLTYMIFDLKLGGPGEIGGIVDNDANPATDPSTLLFVKSTERLTGNPNWVIAHEYGNNSFRAYNITANGIGAPVISDIGADHSITSSQTAQGYMVLGAQDRLAVALSDGTSNAIELFDFVDSTGAVTNYRRVDINEPGGQIYGLVFSPGGNKLYATVNVGTSSFIYEYAIDPQGVITFVQKSPLIPEELGAMAFGPDNQIYVAVNGQDFLYTFAAVEDILQPTPGIVAPQEFDLEGPTSTKGLPNFIQTLGDPVQGPGMSIVGNCVNTPVNFSGTPSDQYRDDFNWRIVDPGGSIIFTSTEETFQFTFTTAGTYQVTLDITSECLNGPINGSPFSQALIIDPEPGAAITPDDGTLVFCTVPGSKSLTAAPNTGSVSYAWTTSETVNPIVVTLAGTYGVTITDNATGCSSISSIELFNNAPIVNLGLDFAMCADETRQLDAQNSALGPNAYTWSIDNVPVPSPGQFFNVNTSLTGTHEYEVTVTDGTCSATDEVLVTVNPIPIYTALPFVLPTCGNSDGVARITITSPGTFGIDVSENGGVFSDIRTGQPAGIVTPDVTGLAGGTYTIIVTNELTGCDAPSAFGLSNTGFVIVAPPIGPTCDPESVTINRTPGTQGTDPVTYVMIDIATGLAVGTPETTSLLSYATAQAFDPGSYIVEARDAINCVATADIDIPQGNQTVFSFDPSCERVEADVDPLILAPANARYLWSVTPGVISSGGAATEDFIIITPGTVSTQTVTVTVSDVTSTLCPSTQTLNVVVEDVNPVITSSNPCADNVTLSASPTGPFTYQWTLPGGGSASGQQLPNITTPGNYTVTAVSSTSGCSGTSPALPVVINGDVTVNLVSTPACEGQEFTLTATADPATAVLSWTLNNTPLNGNVNPITTTLPGNYEVSATIPGCPPARHALNIIPSRVDQGNLPSTVIICNDPDNPDEATRSATLVPGDPDTFLSFSWSNGLTTPTITVDQPGIYTVDLVNVFNCPATDQSEIIIECDPKLDAPNAFRPGSMEPKNTDFYVFPLFIASEDFEVFIFNRWGEMVFQSDNLQFKWNGTYNNTGLALPPGTYSWVAKFKSSYRPEEGIKEKHGGVVLLR